MKSTKIIRSVSALILLLFAGLTVFMSSAVLFDWFGIRAKEGNYVLFIVWTNFAASFLYIMAAYGLMKRKKWTFGVLIFVLMALIVAFIGLQVHIQNGGNYETKTVKAMAFRMIVTLFLAGVAYFKINKHDHQ